MEKKIAIPEGMLQAGRAAYSAYVTAEDGARRILEAALGWLAENPIAPTNIDVANICKDAPHKGYRMSYEWFAAEWQRRMFLAPEEAPKEVKDLMFYIGSGLHSDCESGVDRVNKVILEAYRRGKKAAEPPRDGS